VFDLVEVRDQRHEIELVDVFRGDEEDLATLQARSSSERCVNDPACGRRSSHCNNVAPLPRRFASRRKIAFIGGTRASAGRCSGWQWRWRDGSLENHVEQLDLSGVVAVKAPVLEQVDSPARTPRSSSGTGRPARTPLLREAAANDLLKDCGASDATTPEVKLFGRVLKEPIPPAPLPS